MDAINWVKQELKHIDLGEKRLEKRLWKIAADFSQNPTASIPEFCGGWGATKAAYNFFDNPASDAQEIIKAQRRGTLARIKGHARILILQDTTSFDFSAHSHTKGLGPLDNPKNQGFFTHTSLVVTPDSVPLGVVAQESWVRNKEELGKSEQRHQRPIAEKESYKWLKALDESAKGLPLETEALVVSDRESDIFEYIAHPRAKNVELLVRARHDRCLEDESRKLFLSLDRSPVRGKVTVEVGRRPGQAPRRAECQVYYKRVKLRPPRNRPASWPKLKPIVVWGILIKEVHPPADVEPLSWLLLTTIEINSFEQACQFIEYYALRWIVERFHFVLKSGCQIEKRQLESADRLIRFVAVANVVAWRLLWMTYLGRIDTNLPSTIVLAEYEWKALYSYVHKTALLPSKPPTLGQVTLWIARLGGFLARKSDGPPGVKVLWRGWRRLFDITQTWLIFNPP